MFKRLDAAAGATVRLTFEGQPLVCRDGDSVAAALLSNGHAVCRTTAVSDAARGPYCMMGICYDCLVTIDGRPNRQACMTRAREGMAIERQTGAREVAP